MLVAEETQLKFLSRAPARRLYKPGAQVDYVAAPVQSQGCDHCAPGSHHGIEYTCPWNSEELYEFTDQCLRKLRRVKEFPLSPGRRFWDRPRGNRTDVLPNT